MVMNKQAVVDEELKYYVKVAIIITVKGQIQIHIFHF